MSETKLGGWDALLGRAVRDAEFRELLMTNPDAAAADYDITEDQLADLKEVQADAARKFFEKVGAAKDEIAGEDERAPARAKADWCTDKGCNDR